jgi:hypothetical protein
VVFSYLEKGVHKVRNEQIDGPLIWVAMHVLSALIMEPSNLFFYLYIFFMVKTNQVFIIYNDFVCVRHDHHLKCDLTYWNVYWCVFKTKIWTFQVWCFKIIHVTCFYHHFSPMFFCVQNFTKMKKIKIKNCNSHFFLIFYFGKLFTTFEL